MPKGSKKIGSMRMEHSGLDSRFETMTSETPNAKRDLHFTADPNNADSQRAWHAWRPGKETRNPHVGTLSGSRI